MKHTSAKVMLLGLLLVAMVLSQGCASIISKSKYNVRIASTPSGVPFVVYNKKGEQVYSGTTPTTTPALKAGAGYFSGESYTLEFRRDGYPVQKAEIERGVDGWYIAGNFVFGGLIGWLVVDPLTGAMWTLKDLHVDLDGGAKASLEAPGSLKLVSLDEVPKSLRSTMVRIN